MYKKLLIITLTFILFIQPFYSFDYIFSNEYENPSCTNENNWKRKEFEVIDYVYQYINIPSLFYVNTVQGNFLTKVQACESYELCQKLMGTYGIYVIGLCMDHEMTYFDVNNERKEIFPPTSLKTIGDKIGVLNSGDYVTVMYEKVGCLGGVLTGTVIRNVDQTVINNNCGGQSSGYDECESGTAYRKICGSNPSDLWNGDVKGEKNMTIDSTLCLDKSSYISGSAVAATAFSIIFGILFFVVLLIAIILLILLLSKTSKNEKLLNKK